MRRSVALGLACCLLALAMPPAQATHTPALAVWVRMPELPVQPPGEFACAGEALGIGVVQMGAGCGMTCISDAGCAILVRDPKTLGNLPFHVQVRYWNGTMVTKSSTEHANGVVCLFLGDMFDQHIDAVIPDADAGDYGLMNVQEDDGVYCHYD